MNANQIVQTGGGVVRATTRTTVRAGRLIVTQTFGLVRRTAPTRRRAKPEMDDVTLARKVESEIFRSSRAPKSSVNVNVVDGVVWLRGEVKSRQQIKTLEARARAVPEVRGVENLLHLRKTPAATRADTPRRQQRTRSSTKRPKPRRATGGRITDDRTDAIVGEAEPSPVEHAREREGRAPAPLGSQGSGESSEGTVESAASTGATETATSVEPSPSGNGGETTEQGPSAVESTEPSSTPNGGESAGNGGESAAEGVGFAPGAARQGTD